LPNKPHRSNPLRTGIFAVVLIGCLMLTSFGYDKLPFWQLGASYEAYFVDAAGISVGSDVDIAGITVGRVSSVALTTPNAKVTFTMDRAITLGDRSEVSIASDSVLGQKSLAVTPAGTGRTTTIPVDRTSTPYTLNTALQDLGRSAGDLDKPQLEQALQVLTDTLRDATPQLRDALDGIADLSRTVNDRDEALASLLAHAKSATDVAAQRAAQVNQLVVDGAELFGALDDRRTAIAELIQGISPVSQQISAFVEENRAEFGPALTKLNLVLDNLNERREHISEALKRLPPYETALGEVVSSGPGFTVNLYNVPPVTNSALIFDAMFQPGKMPDSLADLLRGFIHQRTIVRPKSP
jgi:phospholipid/cholesterol/gamma-HCH transport system substrate-binding protein